MDLLIGCPVAHRGWVLPAWFKYVEASCDAARVSPSFVFLTHPQDPVVEVIKEHGPDAVLIPCEQRKANDERVWGDRRYREMVVLRNQLLAAVRSRAPDAFLSLDSDILVAEPVVGLLLEDLEAFDAVGAKCYMTRSSRLAPSWAKLGRNNQIHRFDADGLIPVDVIMAAKMMSPRAYAVDYEWHIQGEDIGWSTAARRAGLRLGWEGRVTSKHVLAPSMLDAVDPRVGF